MQIKTIKSFETLAFDKEVNRYLDENWSIHSLYAHKDSGATTLVAFLIKDNRKHVDLGPV